MKTPIKVLFLSIFAASFIDAPANASEEARAVVEEMLKEEYYRSIGVDAYVVQETNSFGQTNFLMYEKWDLEHIAKYKKGWKLEPTEEELVDQFFGYRLVRPDEIKIRLNNKYGNSPTQPIEVVNAIEKAGKAATLLAMDNDLISRNSAFEIATDLENGRARVTQASVNATLAEADADLVIKGARNHIEELRKFGDQAELRKVGRPDGDFYVLTNSKVDQSHKTEDGTYTINTIQLSIDKKTYVVKELVMSGQSELKKTGKQPFQIKKTSSAYKKVSGGPLFLPFKSDMRITLSSGAENQHKESEADIAKKEKQLKELKKAMGEYEEKLAELSPEQKKMMEQMMGSQMKQMMEQLEQLESDADDLSNKHTVGSVITVDRVCLGGVETWAAMVSEFHNVGADAVAEAGTLKCTTG